MSEIIPSTAEIEQFQESMKRWELKKKIYKIVLKRLSISDFLNRKNLVRLFAEFPLNATRENIISILNNSNLKVFKEDFWNKLEQEVNDNFQETAEKNNNLYFVDKQTQSDAKKMKEEITNVYGKIDAPQRLASEKNIQYLQHKLLVKIAEVINNNKN